MKYTISQLLSALIFLFVHTNISIDEKIFTIQENCQDITARYLALTSVTV